jgi:hypothetical protein
MPDGPNFFARLSKWARRQDENFLTEAFAVLLEHLLMLAPGVGTRLICKLTDGLINAPAEEANTLVLRTQVDVVQGRPDLEISAPNKLVWVEVKAESPLRVGQLEGYRVLLDAAAAGETKLVLLTRYHEEFIGERTRPDLAIRWYELAHWLEAEMAELAATCDLATFLAQQFLDFLGDKGMTLTQVNKYTPDGLRGLSSLLNMLEEAALACKLSVRQLPQWYAIGLYLDSQKYWIGIIFAKPDRLWFSTCCRIDPEAAIRLGVGEITEEKVPGGLRWWRGAEMESEAIHFYSRDKVSQMQWLEEFLRENLAMARSIEVADQSATPGNHDPE